MRARLTKLFAGLTAVAALAIGGSALAGAAGNPTPASPPVFAGSADTPEPGDKADTGGAASESSSEPSESASESASSESTTEGAEQSDGPGGHADEPGNPNADHQFQGEE
jgi:hypothetical protein